MVGKHCSNDIEYGNWDVPSCAKAGTNYTDVTARFAEHVCGHSSVVTVTVE